MNINKSILKAIDGSITAAVQKEDFVTWLLEDELNGFTKEGAELRYNHLCEVSENKTFEIYYTQLGYEYQEFNSTADFCKDHELVATGTELLAIFEKEGLDTYNIIGYIINDEITSIVLQC